MCAHTQTQMYTRTYTHRHKIHTHAHRERYGKLMFNLVYCPKTSRANYIPGAEISSSDFHLFKGVRLPSQVDRCHCVFHKEMIKETDQLYIYFFLISFISLILQQYSIKYYSIDSIKWASNVGLCTQLKYEINFQNVANRLQKSVLHSTKLTIL